MDAFTPILERAVALAKEWTSLDGEISAAAVAADHDSSWGPDDEEYLNGKYARQREVVRLLGAELVSLAASNPTAWQAFLALGVQRLGALTRSDEKSWTRGAYERDEWQRWLNGELPDGDRAVVFARGVANLRQYREEIDRWMAK